MSMRIAILGLVFLWLSQTRADADDAKKTQTFEVPYRLADTKHIIIRAKINGKGPFNLVMDTGAPALFLSKTVGKKIGIEADKKGWHNLERFELEGGAALTNAQARVEDLAPVEAINGLGLAGVEVHGLLGYNVLACFRIEMDFARDKMKWTRLDYKPELPRVGRGGLPMEINAMGAIMKILGVLVGKKANADWAQRGFLGLEFADDAKNLTIKSVLADSPADRAGLKVGDRILRLDDWGVRTQADLRRRASRIGAGGEVVLVIERDGKERQVTFKAGSGL